MKMDITTKILAAIGLVSLLIILLSLVFKSLNWISLSSMPLTLFIIFGLTRLTANVKINNLIKLLIFALIIPILATVIFASTFLIYYYSLDFQLLFSRVPLLLTREGVWLNIIFPIELIFCSAYGAYALFIYRQKQHENKRHLENEMEKLKKEIDELKQKQS
jgi:hypothetical protein